jgi:hypothetical protein
MRTKKLCERCGSDIFAISDRYPLDFKLFWDADEENYFAEEVDPPAFPDQTNVLVKCASCGLEHDILPTYE